LLAGTRLMALAQTLNANLVIAFPWFEPVNSIGLPGEVHLRKNL